MSDREAITVVFRRYSDDTIIALFAYSVCNKYEGTCNSYIHIGQHCAADYVGVIANTKPATESEYASLKKELEDMGYDLTVIKRRSSSHKPEE